MTKELLIEKLLIAIEPVAVELMSNAHFGDISPMHENVLTELCEDIADLLLQVKASNTI